MRNDYEVLKISRFNIEMNLFLSFCANRLIISEQKVWYLMHATDNGLKISVINHDRGKESTGFHRDVQFAP
jgi:hypothetical protein